MEGLYDIVRGDEKIGKAEVLREGLYYRFRCCCDLTGTVMYRITVTCGKKTENLGIPIPEGDAFYLSARLPVSRFLKDEPVFKAVPRHPENQGLWIPISPAEPFAYISELENARMEKRKETMGIFIPDHEAQDQPDNDPNP